MGRRGPKRQHDVDALLDVAMDLVSTGGIEALSMSAVARSLGCSVSGLYRYVASLEGLIVALQKRAILSYRDELEQALGKAKTVIAASPAKGGSDALYLVLVVFRFYVEHAAREPARHRVLDHFLSSAKTVLSDDEAREVDRTLDTVVNLGAGQLEAAVQQGVLPAGDNRQRTYLLWAALHGVSHFRKRDRIQPKTLQSAALTEHLLRAVLIGFGADRGALDAAAQRSAVTACAE